MSDPRDSPRPPSRPKPHLGPGARKEKLRERDYRHRGSGAGKGGGSAYVELHAASAFSFLDGASQPEDLVERAAELGLPALALADRSGVYGVPRLHKAAKEAGIRAIVGAEVVLGRGGAGEDDDGEDGSTKKATRLESTRRSAAAERLTLLARTPEGYRNLCKLLTAAARGRPKGDARASWGLVEAHAAGLHCLTGGAEGPLARRLAEGGLDVARPFLERLVHLFDGRVHAELQRHRLPEEEHRNQAVVELARRLRLPLLATQGARYAHPRDKPIHDVLTAIRHHETLDTAGAHLARERERHLKSPGSMRRLFADLPEAVAASVDLASELEFSLENLGYRFPDVPLPPGETAASYLRQLTWNAARARFRPFTARAQAQIEKELEVIEKLGLAGYFLLVWDIIRFCQRQGILVQGRGSAANSAVCYCLAITAVDPVKMELLFERFLSEERGEWPDIDLDLPSGTQREKVIQYVYARYGPHGAAMTANVITYRDRLAAREAGKVLGFSEEQIGRLSKRLHRLRYDLKFTQSTSGSTSGDDAAGGGAAGGGAAGQVEEEIRAAGCDPEDRRVRLFIDLWQRLQNLPRHLGQHSGGMIIAAGRLDEVVPLEPAAMAGRTVVQWDKDDCADLGILKVDLLGLGMLNALEEAVPLIRRTEGKHVDLAHLPEDDPQVYDLLRRADTVGVFQVESRAQMASLPRNAPERFYDLVIQVAIIRPGPITGGMVHPFFERRQGREPVEYLHPSLEPILKRTLGVPIFQEQILRIAMVAAGFSGGEAEQLRRAMGFKRSTERMEELVESLRAGMEERGIDGATRDQIVQSITSFALYGFPESHAASFALIAYASAWLKVHHPTAFFVSLLNAWPMGFYHPATLIKDASRRGVEVRPVDVRHSDWRSTWEPASASSRVRGALRLGLRFVRGVRRELGETLEAERRRRPFESVEDLAVRLPFRGDELDRLAHSGALQGFGLERRAAVWQASRLARPSGPLFADEPSSAPSPLPPMSALEQTIADYVTCGLSAGPHPMAYYRGALRERGVLTTSELLRRRAGERVTFAGAVIVRQRPGTAKGILFVTLEDETGMAQAVLMPDLLAETRHLVSEAPGLVIEGELQRRDGSLSVRADKLWPLPRLQPTASHDFH